jgi:hypothetical protein
VAPEKSVAVGHSRHGRNCCRLDPLTVDSKKESLPSVWNTAPAY